MCYWPQEQRLQMRHSVFLGSNLEWILSLFFTIHQCYIIYIDKIRNLKRNNTLRLQSLIFQGSLEKLIQDRLARIEELK
jgi:hypothetical protein